MFGMSVKNVRCECKKCSWMSVKNVRMSVKNVRSYFEPLPIATETEKSVNDDAFSAAKIIPGGSEGRFCPPGGGSRCSCSPGSRRRLPRSCSPGTRSPADPPPDPGQFPAAASGSRQLLIYQKARFPPARATRLFSRHFSL